MYVHYRLLYETENVTTKHVDFCYFNRYENTFDWTDKDLLLPNQVCPDTPWKDILSLSTTLYLVKTSFLLEKCDQMIWPQRMFSAHHQMQNSVRNTKSKIFLCSYFFDMVLTSLLPITSGDLIWLRIALTKIFDKINSLRLNHVIDKTGGIGWIC